MVTPHSIPIPCLKEGKAENSSSEICAVLTNSFREERRGLWLKLWWLRLGFFPCLCHTSVPESHMEPSEMPWSKLLPMASGCRHSIVPAAGPLGVTVPVPALDRERGYSLCLLHWTSGAD